jgi:hypothetical protein
MAHRRKRKHDVRNLSKYSVKLIDEHDPHLDLDAYTQRINYEYFQQIKPHMVGQIAAICEPPADTSTTSDLPA